MKSHGLLLLAVLSFGISGCAMLPWAAEPPVQTLTLNGEAYSFRQITEGTWTANTDGKRKVLPGAPSDTAALQQAVEKLSGCTVTDSDYSRQGTQFDAQVSCAGGTAN